MGNNLSVTNKNGDYLFKNVNPGDYILEIDRTTTEINDIPDTNVPVSLILTGKENIYNFGLTSAAKILGKIEYKEHENNLQFAQLSTKKNENLIAEVTNGNQTFRKLALLGDYFDFTYLRPGDWK